jgi:hypothetical protein
MAPSSVSKKSHHSDLDSDSEDEVRDELPFLHDENERLGKLLDNRDDMLREAQLKSKPKLIRFRCDYCGRDGHKGEFCFKRKHEERMEKEWDNKDKYHPSNGILEP